MCVFSSHPFWTSSSLDVPAGVTQEEGHTGFLIHLPSAVLRKNLTASRPSEHPPVRGGNVNSCRWLLYHEYNVIKYQCKFPSFVVLHYYYNILTVFCIHY